MSNFRTRSDIGLLVLRVVTGIVFLMHGYQKVFTYGFGGVTQGFTQMHIPMPTVMGPAIGLLELIGGIALIAGAFTRIFGLLFLCDMLGALFLVHIKGGFFMPNGYEFVLVLAAASATLAISGGGPMAIDSRMSRRSADA